MGKEGKVISHPASIIWQLNMDLLLLQPRLSEEKGLA